MPSAAPGENFRGMRSAPQTGPLSQLEAALRGIAERLRELEGLCRDAAVLAERLAEEHSPGDGRRAATPRPSARPDDQNSVSDARPGIAPAEPADEPGGLEMPQAALLVALTLRGGTLPEPALALLASDLGLPPAGIEELFHGSEPHLVRRPGGAAGVTERGIESAAAWRTALPAELLRLATDL